MTTRKILTKTEFYVVCSTTARSSHYLTQSSKLPMKLVSHSAPFARPTHSRSTGRAAHIWSSDCQTSLPLVTSIKQPSSIVPNFKPFTYDTSLSTLSKVRDKACSIICLKLTSSLRSLALALTSILARRSTMA